MSSGPEFALVRKPKPLGEVLASLTPPIGLLGLGEEGRATLAFLKKHAVGGLRGFDRNPATEAAIDPAHRSGLELHTGDEYAAGLAECRTIFRSPGVRPDLLELVAARRQGARITSATRLFLSACPGPVVGVTGTVGKGTTVALIGEALKAAGRSHRLGGNIGTNPLLFLDEIGPGDVSVLELSSFQLMDLDADQPDVAVVLRTTSEHLDWHRDRDEYLRAKSGNVAPESSVQRLIVCADAPGSREVAGGSIGRALTYSLTGSVVNGIGFARGQMVRSRVLTLMPLPEFERLALPGEFNRENAAAALLAAEALGVPLESALPAIAAFPGLPHRLERAGEVGNVLCVNDSYATRPEATLGALSAFGQGPLALILGGSEKHADFGPLMEALCHLPKLRKVMFIGATADRMSAELAAAAERVIRFAPRWTKCENLETAFEEGLAALEKGGTLLLSPACASFGLFPNYKVRGERFRELVRAAKQRPV
jgi:UDP-N-acetylmuramoylalanine--D-glutamate ligase